MINKADSFEAELKQLRQDFHDGAISKANYLEAVKGVFTRWEVTKLESNWWAKYQLKDAPVTWINPHFESIWMQASPDKQDIARMAIGVMREINYRKKAAKYACLKEQLERQGIYTGVSIEQFMRGGVKTSQIMVAAIMEVFTPTGLYSTKLYH